MTINLAKNFLRYASLPLAIVFALVGCSTNASTPSTKTSDAITVNIGIQQSLSPLLLAKEKGLYEQAFAKVGAHVHWVEFQSGPPYFQSIASDRLDFGQVGNTPPIVGQAAGVNFKEINVTTEGLQNDAILVPKDSPVHTIKGLIGKKVAVAKGSSAYGMLYTAFHQAGIKPSQVNIVQLQPKEAQAAFDSHAIDAWVIWDPFVAYETQKNGARIISTEKNLGIRSPAFTIVRTKFAQEHPDLVVLFLKVYQQALDWQNQHPDEAVEVYQKAKNLDKSIIKTSIQNHGDVNQPISPQDIQSQQATADLLFQLGGITKPVDVSKVVDNTFVEQAMSSKP